MNRGVTWESAAVVVFTQTRSVYTAQLMFDSGLTVSVGKNQTGVIILKKDSYICYIFLSDLTIFLVMASDKRANYSLIAAIT